MTADHPHVDVTATCACGELSMTLRGPVLSMLLCSCLDCQKATGTGHSTAALVNKTSLGVTGCPKTYSRPADSGAVLTQHFCASCGTHLYASTSRFPELRLIPVGFFAGATDWFTPNQLVFARSHQHWDAIAADLPRHEKYRPPTAPK